MNRRMLNSCSKSYSLRISSVSTEQLRIGVIQFGLRESEEPENASTHEEHFNKGLMRSVEADEVNSLVSTPRLITASGNRSGDLKTFDDLPVHSQYSMFCDLVSWRKVKPNDFFISKPSLSNRHGIVGIDGLEVTVPPRRDYSTTSWVLISRGKNRCVDEMEDPNISHNVSSINLLKEQADSKGARAPEDVEHSFRERERATTSSSSSRLDTNPINHKEQPVCFTKTTILTLERNWKTIPRYPGNSERSLSSSISEMVSKLKRHFDQDDKQNRWSRTLGYDKNPCWKKNSGIMARRTFRKHNG